MQLTDDLSPFPFQFGDLNLEDAIRYMRARVTRQRLAKRSYCIMDPYFHPVRGQCFTVRGCTGARLTELERRLPYHRMSLEVDFQAILQDAAEGGWKQKFVICDNFLSFRVFQNWKEAAGTRTPSPPNRITTIGVPTTFTRMKLPKVCNKK